jgi:cytochrome c peroxidase
MPGAVRFAVAAFALGAAGCGPPDGFTPTEWEVVQGLSPLPALPADPTNRHADDPAAAALGRLLFHEPGYSGPLNVADNGGLGLLGDGGKVSCFSCHQLANHFADGRSPAPRNVSVGANFTLRNVPSLLNVGYARWFTLAGRLDTLWTQGSVSPESSDLAGDRCRVAHLLWRDYRAEYEAVFADSPLPPELDPGSAGAARFPEACKPCGASCSGPWEGMRPEDRESVMRIMSNVGKAFAAYERKLVTGPAPFDRYAAGETPALSGAAKRGLKLFIGQGFCVQCHGGPLFSDQLFHNLGVPQEGPHVPAVDNGRYDDAGRMLDNPYNGASEYSDDVEAGYAKLDGWQRQQPADMGAFLTGGLRGVAGTPPYGHSGSLATLSDVVQFYADGGGSTGFVGTKDVKMQPLSLSEQDKQDLVAFLESLSGEEPGPELGPPRL